jgi:Asp-tRNA(Asn)/Glu-tRNA(Gln) amidotransferase A subunit family amidase
LIFAPTVPDFPFKIGEKNTDPIQMYLCDVFTCIFNPIKVPALNVPLGLFDVNDQNSQVPVFGDKQLQVTSSRNRAVALIQVDNSDKFVTFQKTSKVEDDEYYDSNAFFLPGGMVEAEENSTTAAIRETMEEIGLGGLQFVQDLGSVKKILKFKDEVVENTEDYILFQVNSEELKKLHDSEIKAKNWEVKLATIEDLKSNNWEQLNFVLDKLATPKNESKTVKLPTGCQIIGPELSEDRIYTLALEIEQLVRG